MATKLETFLTENKIDHRRLVNASRQIERLRPADRAIRLVHHQARLKEDAKKPGGLDKPRSGRTITAVGLRNAFAGKRTSGPMKTRMLRAVNRILEQRKKPAVELADLFDPPPAKAPEAAADE